MTDKAKKALQVLADNNPLNNDFDAYCFDVAMWGLGKKLNLETTEWVDYGDEYVEQPNPKDYGL
ncbi:MAG: hypothetical protein RL755_27 [Pseudomonadota bacterium]|jgi:hypothetical protein